MFVQIGRWFHSDRWYNQSWTAERIHWSFSEEQSVSGGGAFSERYDQKSLHVNLLLISFFSNAVACNAAITLTASSLVLFAELDWNPSVSFMKLFFLNWRINRISFYDSVSFPFSHSDFGPMWITCTSDWSKVSGHLPLFAGKRHSWRLYVEYGEREARRTLQGWNIFGRFIRCNTFRSNNSGMI